MIEDKIFEIRSGRAQEYLVPLQQIHENMRMRTEVAAIRKQYALAFIQNQFEAEALAAQQNLVVSFFLFRSEVFINFVFRANRNYSTIRSKRN